jgi:hypothetical protein
VGGVFLEMLYDRPIWKKWAGSDRTKASNWAPFPKAPKTVVVVPTSEFEPVTWRYTTESPMDGWTKPEFDASMWQEGPAGFGTRGTPGAIARTRWNTKDIWLRRDFDLPDGPREDLQLMMHHDEDAEVYIDGTLAAKVTGYDTAYETVPIRSQARNLLKSGKHSLAVHCHQTQGGQYIDVGIVDVRAE